MDITIVRARSQVESVIGDRRKKDNPKEWDFWIDTETKIAYVRADEFRRTRPPTGD